MKPLPFLLFLLTVTAAAAVPDFHKDVAPILREYCAGCHNDDELDGEFSVETFKSLMAGGDSGKAIAPGNAGFVFSFDPATGGALGLADGTEPGLTLGAGGAVTVLVPEPTTALLFGLGLIGLGVAGRRS